MGQKNFTPPISYIMYPNKLEYAIKSILTAKSHGSTTHTALFGLEPQNSHRTSSTYVDALKHRLKAAYELATQEAHKARVRQKETFDHKVKGAVMEPSDRVLVKTAWLTRKTQKLQSMGRYLCRAFSDNLSISV